VGIGAIAIALGNGNVLYAGGADGPGASAPTARAALYNDLAFTWSATGSMVTARRDATAATLPDGRILVAGGTGPDGSALASAETFDPATHSWAAVTPMSTPRVGAALVNLDDGRVLAVGGTGPSAEVYDPATDRWTATPAPADVEGSSSNSEPLVHAAKLADGTVVAVDAVHTARFVPTSNTWRRLPDAPFGGHAYGSLVHLADGRLLYAYGTLGPVAGTSSSADVLGPPVTLRVLSATGDRVRYRLGEQGPARFSLARAKHRKFARLRGRVAQAGSMGVNVLPLRGRWRGHALKAGLYRLKVVASSRTDLVDSRPVFVKFRIR
jgi:hypothetical protein